MHWLCLPYFVCSILYMFHIDRQTSRSLPPFDNMSSTSSSALSSASSSASKNTRSPPPLYRNAGSLPDEYAKTTRLPEHRLTSSSIWCKRCSRFRSSANFANNRLNNAMFWLSKGVKMGDKKILNKMICSNCTAVNPVELKCTGCNKTRSLDKFSATQKRDPDTARCRKCISEIENIRPGQQDPYEAEDSDEDYMTVSIPYMSGKTWLMLLNRPSRVISPPVPLPTEAPLRLLAMASSPLHPLLRALVCQPITPPPRRLAPAFQARLLPVPSTLHLSRLAAADLLLSNLYVHYNLSVYMC